MKQQTLIALLATLLTASVQAASPRRPRIVFLLSDDQPLRAMGHRESWFHTPNLDRLAQEGVVFENGFVDSSVCCVSRASIMMGREDSTVIIFASDNGSMWGTHGIAGKWNMYEESIRVPMMIYDPRLPKSSCGVRSQMVLNYDLTATVMDVASVPAPQMQGRSLVPVMTVPDSPRRIEWDIRSAGGRTGVTQDRITVSIPTGAVLLDELRLGQTWQSVTTKTK